MRHYLGTFPTGGVIRKIFATTVNGQPVAPSEAFTGADLRIYKDGGASQKQTANGVTITMPFDGLDYLASLQIDTNNETGETAGWWSDGGFYEVVLMPATSTLVGRSIRRVILSFNREGGSSTVTAHQARAGVCYAGATSSGLYQPGLRIAVDGTVVSGVPFQSLRIVDELRAPSMARAALRGQTVQPLESFQVLDGGDTPETAFRIHFNGHVMARGIHHRRAGAQTVDIFDAMDLSWALNRFSHVTKRYYSTPVNAMVHDLLTTFTDGFILGETSEDLGSLEMTFTYERVTRALARIAEAVGGYVKIDPRFQSVAIVSDFEDGHAITLDDANQTFWDLEYLEDAGQLRNQVTIEGRGSILAAASVEDATTVEVEDASWADPTGGTARINQTLFTWTGVSGTTLTGCTNVPDAAQGTPVNLLVVVSDTTSQDLVKIRIATGSGRVVHYLQDRRLSDSEATARAAADVAAYASDLATVTYQTRSPLTKLGKVVTIDSLMVGDMRTIADALVITRVVTTGDQVPAQGQPTGLHYAVTASPLLVTLPEFLVRQWQKTEVER